MNPPLICSMNPPLVATLLGKHYILSLRRGTQRTLSFEHMLISFQTFCKYATLTFFKQQTIFRQLIFTVFPRLLGMRTFLSWKTESKRGLNAFSPHLRLFLLFLFDKQKKLC